MRRPPPLSLTLLASAALALGGAGCILERDGALQLGEIDSGPITRIDSGSPPGTDGGPGVDSGPVIGVDAGPVTGVDAGPDTVDAGPPDAGPPDAGPPDAGTPQTCEERYSDSVTYYECPASAGECRFFIGLVWRNCDEYCGDRGGACLRAEQNASSTGSMRCTMESAIGCDGRFGDAICVCTMP